MEKHTAHYAITGGWPYFPVVFAAVGRARYGERDNRTNSLNGRTPAQSASYMQRQDYCTSAGKPPT